MKYNQAIEDYTKAIELQPDFATAYNNRGNAYVKQGEYELAIADYNKAIELKLDFADAYYNRGNAYAKQGEYKLAIEDYDKAIEFKPKYAGAYYNRGIAYLNKNEDKLKLAFEDFCNSNKYDKDVKKMYTHVFEDFCNSNEHDKDIKKLYTHAYIVYEINKFFIEKNEDKKIKTFALVINLLNVIVEIKEELLYKLPNSSKFSKFAHYTSLHVLKNLACGNSNFRLYNTACMNDRQEGASFFDMIKKEDEKDFVRKFYEENENYSHSAYVGSFIQVDPKEEKDISKKEKDILSFWRMYGKHDGEEAAGACLIFKHDNSHFADTVSMMTGTMEQLQIANKEPPATPHKKESKLELYKIAYENDCKEGTVLGKKLKTLANGLKEIDKFFMSELENEDKKVVSKIVRELLDLIRFLFKTNHYSGEEEFRVIKIYYPSSDDKQPNDEKIKIDMEQFPPRFYLNTPENFCFGEAILGPQVSSENDWRMWGKQQEGRYKDLKIEKSKIEYGKKQR